MKTNSLQSMVLENRWRRAVLLFAFLSLICLAVTSGLAQVKNRKRVTALQLGEAAEGARVTIVSDSALNDYEAFRQGDRFYVKIPLADFTAAPPNFRGNGFEDVRVQKVGDSAVVAFKLQAGATARVDQRSNRLDVVFSSPNRTFRNPPANAASNRVATGPDFSRTSQAQGPDAAGPMPPGSAPASSQRADRTPAANESRAQNQTTGGNTHEANQSSTGKTQSTSSNAAIELPSPAPSSSAILTPSTSETYPALTTATPAASGGLLNWKARGRATRQWVSANRLATLLGALILLSLILYLATALLRRRKKAIAAKRLNASKAQPKPSSGTDFDELPGDGSVASPTSRNLPQEFVEKPAIASAVAAATPQNHSHQHSSDKEEREVFEL